MNRIWVKSLYPTLSKKKGSKLSEKFMNFLQYADGTNSLEKISSLIKLDNMETKKIFLKLRDKNLLI